MSHSCRPLNSAFKNCAGLRAATFELSTGSRVGSLSASGPRLGSAEISIIIEISLNLSYKRELDELLTTHDLAARFNVSPMTIFNWRRYRNLPVVLIDGSAKHGVRFHPRRAQVGAPE
jgi:hypothetical protein